MEAGYVERRVAELEGALARERSLRTGPAAATNLTYLKNTLLQYIRAPTSEKGMMVKAISAVLHLTPEEMREMTVADEEAKAASGLLGFLWHDPRRRAKVRDAGQWHMSYRTRIAMFVGCFRFASCADPIIRRCFCSFSR